MAPTGGGLTYRRVVVKVGTNLLTGGSDKLDAGFMSGLVAQIAGLRKQGVELLLVTSGAIAAGQEALALPKGRREVALKQMMAAVGQGRLMHRYQELFDEHNVAVAQALITKGDLDNRESYLNVRNTFEGLVSLGVVPIINENDVVDVREIREDVFGDNDNLSAVVATVVDADLLIILTDIDGLYTADPRRESGAKLVPRVERIDAAIESLAGGTGSARGRGGMLTKIQAAKVATAAGVPVVIANGHERDALTRLARGEAIGTFFVATASKADSRQRWMLTGIGAKGAIVVDEGAAKALAQEHRSLLPAGVRAIEGQFDRGDLIDIRDSHGGRIGRGVSNYGSAELEKIKGARSADIKKMLGYTFGDEVVHRNDLATFTGVKAS
jgi:glutamate 5-kinase